MPIGRQLLEGDRPQVHRRRVAVDRDHHHRAAGRDQVGDDRGHGGVPGGVEDDLGRKALGRRHGLQPQPGRELAAGRCGLGEHDPRRSGVAGAQRDGDPDRPAADDGDGPRPAADRSAARRAPPPPAARRRRGGEVGRTRDRRSAGRRPPRPAPPRHRGSRCRSAAGSRRCAGGRCGRWRSARRERAGRRRPGCRPADPRSRRRRERCRHLVPEDQPGTARGWSPGADVQVGAAQAGAARRRQRPSRPGSGSVHLGDRRRRGPPAQVAPASCHPPRDFCAGLFTGERGGSPRAPARPRGRPPS